MNKKFLAKLLIFCMVFTMLPMAAFADTTTKVDGATYTIAMDTTDLTLNEEKTATVTATLTYTVDEDTKTATQTVAYSTLNADVATVNAEGLVTAVAAGNTVVKAYAEVGGKQVSVERKVIVLPVVTEVVTVPTVEEDGTKVAVSTIEGLTEDVIAANLNTPKFDEYVVGDDTQLVINLKQAEPVDKVVANIDTATVDMLIAHEDYTGVILDTDVAEVALPETVLTAAKTALAANEGAVLELVVEPKEAPASLTDVKAVYEVTLQIVKGETATKLTFNGNVQLTVAVPAGFDTTKNPKVTYLNDAGTSLTNEVLTAGYNADKTAIWFNAPHFSQIAIAEQATDDTPSYGGGGGSTGNVSIATKVTGGKVTVTPTRPTRGQTVTINVTANEGYKLDTLVVTDNKGNNVELIKVSDTKYTFVMPAGKVTVTPTFVKTDATEETKDPAAVKRFSDVASGAWYAEYITYVTENALMNGYDDGRFGPNDQTTRAQIVTVLYRLEGEPATRSSNSFSDVSAGGQYYSSAVAWAAINNIVNGYEDGRFGPNDNVTREQIATILYRYATYKGYDTENAGSIAEFSDAAKVSSWANTAISWAVGEGLMNGDNGALRPQGNATRAEIAALLMRFAENIAK